MKFTKMHGIGNDYIYLYDEQADFPRLAQQWSLRQKGIGGDGLIHIQQNSDGIFHMEIFNADGSEGNMCGNGIRCVGKYLYDRGLLQEKSFQIDTKSGLRSLEVEVDDENKVSSVTVEMGVPSQFQPMVLSVGQKTLEGVFVSMGNPHFVVLCENPDEIPVEKWGEFLEKHSSFAPDGVNVEFYSPTDDGFRLRVWERGSGETQACGTGACACYAVGQKLGILDKGTLTAELLGGELILWEKEGKIFMKGEAVEVFQGEIAVV